MTVPSTSSATPAMNPTLAAREGNAAFATSIALLLMRLTLGWVFVFHGAQKLFGWFDGKGMDAFISSNAIQAMPVLPPEVWGWTAALSEFAAGILLIVGLFTRLAALPIIASMIVAIWQVHGPHGFAITNRPVPGYEYNLVLITMATALILAGPGIISLDALLFRQGIWARGPQPLGDPERQRPA